jgi:hypothetical protein
LTKAQQELLQKPTIQQAFPEYYLIQTTKFKDVIQEPLDEWIYFFKNNEVKDGFSAKGMGAVREKLAINNLPDDDKKKYNKFLDNLHWEASVAQTAKIEENERIAEKVEEILEEAKEVERLNERFKIASQLIKMNLKNEQITAATGLSNIEIEELRKNS